MTKSVRLEGHVIKFAKQAKELDWCDLVYKIIKMELTINNKGYKTDNELKLLEFKLYVYENDKLSRISKEFNSEYFIEKNYEYFNSDL